MMKLKLTSLLILICIIIGTLVSCGEPCQHTNVVGNVCADCGETVEVEHIDYAGTIPFDKNDMTTRKVEVDKVHLFVDGDTVHFEIPENLGIGAGGVLKARFLAVDTPESTGRIEEWGSKASDFTHSVLSSAESIVLESNDANWNADSTGGRYLLWIWYKPEGSDTYRNLNIELLQNGLAIAYNTGSTKYGETGFKAINQAKLEKLNIYSGQKDPDFYYGDAIELTLKELRTNTALYDGMKVAFEGVVTIDNNQSVYVEEFDEETGVYFGMAVYYGYNLNGDALSILTVGNRVRIVGTVKCYEATGNYQVSGLQYRSMKPDDPSNIQEISKNNPAAYQPITPEQFASGKVTVTTYEGEGEELTEVEKTLDFALATMNSTVSMKNLKVVSISTTVNEESSQKGAMTLTCTANGKTIQVRTVVLYDEDGKLITSSYFMNKTIDVRGMVDCYNGDYQIKVFSLNDIEIK